MPFVDRWEEHNPDLLPDPSPDALPDLPRSVVLLAVLIMAIVPIWYFIGDYLTAHLLQVLTLAKTHTSALFFQMLFVAIVFAVSASLYVLRTNHRKWYAALEISLGISASVFSANGIYLSSEHDTQFRNLVAAFGGIYIIIRGLDNWAKPPKAP